MDYDRWLRNVEGQIAEVNNLLLKTAENLRDLGKAVKTIKGEQGKLAQRLDDITDYLVDDFKAKWKMKMDSRNDIRNRVSYRLFREAYNRLCDVERGAGDKEDFLRWLYDEIDHRRGWRTRTLSEYAEESLEVLLEDVKDEV